MKRLLVDAGNSRVKWATSEWVETERPNAHAACPYAALEPLRQALSGVDEVWIASVAGAEKNQLLDRLFTGLAVHRLHSEAACCGVVNQYQPPASLGVDRWMALIGARARGASPALVVSAGTALTVDALDASGRFLGGVIAPGRSMMQTSLLAGTAGIKAEGGTLQAMPRNTSDALASGVLAAMAGAVTRQYRRLQAMSPSPPRCLVSGGDAAWLCPQLDFPAEIVASLVLEGIARVAAASGEKVAGETPS